jgi:hypothetical protein
MLVEDGEHADAAGCDFRILLGSIGYPRKRGIHLIFEAEPKSRTLDLVGERSVDHIRRCGAPRTRAADQSARP